MLTIKKTQSAPKLWSGTPGSSAVTIEAESWTETWVDGSKVILNWTWPGLGDITMATYKIYKGGQFLMTVPATQTSYEDMNVASGLTYTYQVFYNYS